MAKSKANSSASAGKIVVENFNIPGYTQTVDAAMHAEMRRALVAILPTEPPSMTQTRSEGPWLVAFSARLYPGGAMSDWWPKLVQLDLEAKGIVRRENGKPLHWQVVKK